ARGFEGFDDDHPAAATGASARWRRGFGLAVRLGARAHGRGLGRGKRLAGARDVAGSNRAGEEAVVADAVEAARQDVQEKAADELGGVERHGPEPVAAFDPVVLTWGASGQGAIRSCVLPAHLVGSVSTFRSLSASVDISP